MHVCPARPFLRALLGRLLVLPRAAATSRSRRHTRQLPRFSPVVTIPGTSLKRQLTCTQQCSLNVCHPRRVTVVDNFICLGHVPFLHTNSTVCHVSLEQTTQFTHALSRMLPWPIIVNRQVHAEQWDLSAPCAASASYLPRLCKETSPGAGCRPGPGQ